MLSPLLFIIVLEPLSRKIRSGRPEELLYADDLQLVSETIKGLKGRMVAWKGALESKGWRVNVKKTKVMISSENAGKVTIERKFPCTVLLVVVPSYASLASDGFIRNVILLEVN